MPFPRRGRIGLCSSSSAVRRREESERRDFFENQTLSPLLRLLLPSLLVSPRLLAAAPAAAASSSSSLGRHQSTAWPRQRLISDRSLLLSGQQRKAKLLSSPRSSTMASSPPSPFSAVDKTPPSAPSNQTVSVCADPATGAKELGRLVRSAAARATGEREEGRSDPEGDGGEGDDEKACAPSHDGSKWHAFWADERLVPGDSPESNAGGAKAFLEKVKGGV